MKRDEIIEAMANLFWWDAWATHVEEHDCVNLSGCEISEHAPERPEGILPKATKVAEAIEKASLTTLGELYLRALEANKANPEKVHGRRRDFDSAENFGSCLAYQFMGAGVSWEDDNAPVPGLVVPRGESFWAEEFWTCEEHESE